MPIPFKIDLNISVGNQQTVEGVLTLPDNAKGLVIFSNESGNIRLGTRNNKVSAFLEQQHFGTFLFDLLMEEGGGHYNQVNIRLMAERLVIVSEWLLSFEQTQNIHQAYFGSNAGAAAALYAAAAEGSEIAAIVCSGGRPDLAMEVLPNLQAPTLFIVGSDDNDIVMLNQKALSAMHCPRRLEVIPDASNILEEKGAMEKVCLFTSGWLEQYLHPMKMLSK